MSKKLSMRLATHAIVAGLALSSGTIGAAVLAPTALAESATPDTLPAKGAKGSLTIHKKLNPTKLGTPNGKEATDVTGKDLDGVTFKIQELDFDVTTNAGLKAAAAISAADAKDHIKKGGHEDTQTTENGGTATFSDMPVGAYLVHEESAPENVSSKSADFIAFIPMTDQDDRSKWIYDVVAYPKNSSFGLEKALADGDENKVANVGDDISYVITGDRPALDPKKQYISYYQIVDEIPSELKFKSVSVKIAGAAADDADYTADPAGTTDKVKVTLTKAGEDKLLNADPSAKVEVTFNFTVGSKNGEAFSATDTADATYKVTNRKSDVPDGETPTTPGDEPDPNTPPDDGDKPGGDKPSVTETWIPVEISKYGKEASGTKLPGAKFEVYRCTAKGSDAVTNGMPGVLDGDALKFGEKTAKEFTTGDDGTVKIDSLRFRKDRGERDGYCLVEVEAPKGYELAPEPIFFRLKEAENKPVLETNKLDVTDVPEVGPKLPATGGMGVGLLLGLGALVLGAGAYAARRNTRASS